jgi:hypothetical protein
MAYGYGRRNRATGTTHTTHTTTTARPTFMSRFRRRPAYATDGAAATTTTTRRDRRAGVRDSHNVGGMHYGTHGGTTAPIHHHKRHVTIGDKISGAMMKLRGSLTNRPGVKVSF